MATSNVTVKIEGLEALEALVQQLNAAIERIEGMRPIYGDVYINPPIDEALQRAAQEARTAALAGHDRVNKR